MMSKTTRGFRAGWGVLLAAWLIVSSWMNPFFSGSELDTGGSVVSADSGSTGLIFLNPKSASPGQTVVVEGIGFPPGQAFEFTVTYNGGAERPVGQAEADERGRIGDLAAEIPSSMLSGTFTVRAQSTQGSAGFSASGYVTSRIPTLSLSKDTGKAGDVVAFSATGFAPGEQVLAYLNGVIGQPFATLPADQWGNVSEAPAAMPYGPTGENTVILVGDQSKAVATASFIVIGFFPAVSLSTYAPKGDEAVAFVGNDFGPNERVRVHLNDVATAPIKTVTADASGSFNEPDGFDVPFGLKGKQTFIFVGESSGAVVPADVEVVLYSPSVDPSTWAGRPGTSVTFYGSGFARNELVRVRRAATRSRAAQEASCFRTNENGEVGGLGSYIVQSTDEAGQLNLELVTEKSQLTIPLSIQVLPAIGDLPPGAIQSNSGCPEQRE